MLVLLYILWISWLLWCEQIIKQFFTLTIFITIKWGVSFHNVDQYSHHSLNIDLWWQKGMWRLSTIPTTFKVNYTIKQGQITLLLKGLEHFNNQCKNFNYNGRFILHFMRYICIEYICISIFALYGNFIVYINLLTVI